MKLWSMVFCLIFMITACGDDNKKSDEPTTQWQESADAIPQSQKPAPQDIPGFSIPDAPPAGGSVAVSNQSGYDASGTFRSCSHSALQDQCSLGQGDLDFQAACPTKGHQAIQCPCEVLCSGQ